MQIQHISTTVQPVTAGEALTLDLQILVSFMRKSLVLG